jgi:hypothetical protein
MDIPEMIHFIICFFLVLEQVRWVIYWARTQYPECDAESGKDMRKFIHFKTNGLLSITAFCICNVKLHRVVLDKEWPNLLAFLQFQLQLLLLEDNGPRWFFLIYGNPVLDISCPICVLQSTERLREVTVTWWHTCYHYCLAVTCKSYVVIRINSVQLHPCW